ncbi:MAG: hypothetical protein QXN34_03175 [Archaeoglobaceae archaeon]
MIVNFLAVNTAWNREKVVEIMDKKRFDATFLDLPESFEPYIAKKIYPVADLGYVQDLKASEPILNFCWKKEIPVYCYIDTGVSEKKREIQIELARLALKSKISRINVHEWKKVIFRDLMLRNSSSEYIAMKICERAMDFNVCLNLPPEVENFLEEEGFKVERFQLYDFGRPIDKLYEIALKEMRGEDISNEKWLELIKKHLAFIDTVIEVGYEEACKFIWI